MPFHYNSDISLLLSVVHLSPNLRNFIMDTEMFNLTCDAFQQSAKETFRSLVNEEDFMDVTLACDDDKQLRAHKVILSACSPFFKRILSKNPHPNPLLFISGVTYRDLKAILNFMYLGETNVEQCHLDSFMSACNIIKVKGLTEPEELEPLQPKIQEPLPQKPHVEKLPKERIKVPQPTPNLNPQMYTPSVVKTEHEDYENFENPSTAVAEFEPSEDFTSPFETSSKWSDGKFWCSKCDFQTGTKSNLKRHDEMKHQCIKYSCNGCDYKASSKDNLKRHSMSKHEGVMFDCNHCEFKTSLKGSLRRHNCAMHSTIL
jgi:hypothetical protein